MKTYVVKTYNDKVSYTVSLDEDGTVTSDDLLPQGLETLQFGVTRNITNHGMAPVLALQQAVGSYSYLTEVEDG